MKKHTVIEYEQEDFNAVRDNMTTEKAIEILEGLPFSRFKYNIPTPDNPSNIWDYDEYKICCAIWHAVDKLREVCDK